MNNISITIGQYVKGNSFIHRLDPRFKIISTIILLAAIFLVPATNLANVYVLLGFLLFLILLIFVGRLSFINVIKGLQPILFIGLFTIFLQIIYNSEGTLLYQTNIEFSLITIGISALILLFWIFTSKYVNFKIGYFILMLFSILAVFLFVKTNYGFNYFEFNVYTSGLLKGLFFFLRLVLVIMTTTILTMTTSTTDINLGLEWVFYPLKFIKVPIGEISMMFSLTLRFIPTLLIETEKIMKAQASRGIDFNEGNLISKVKQIITLLIPMVVVSLNRAEDLAYAMEARGYIIGSKRTSIDVLKFRLADIIGFVLVIGFLSFSIYLRVI